MLFLCAENLQHCESGLRVNNGNTCFYEKREETGVKNKKSSLQYIFSGCGGNLCWSLSLNIFYKDTDLMILEVSFFSLFLFFWLLSLVCLFVF